eukprot:PhF_6_TR949/c0_g1_i2/m.1753
METADLDKQNAAALAALKSKQTVALEELTKEADDKISAFKKEEAERVKRVIEEAQKGSERQITAAMPSVTETSVAFTSAQESHDKSLEDLKNKLHQQYLETEKQIRADMAAKLEKVRQEINTSHAKETEAARQSCAREIEMSVAALKRSLEEESR